MTRERTEPTYTVDIYMAGDLDQARHVCREYCLEVGFCVTIVACDFVYTGGAESGVKIGCINYPRFPATPAEIWGKALPLAERLRARLCQQSYSLVAPDKTLWVSERD